MKIPITLKEKHLAHVGKYLNSMPIGDWGGVSNVIVSALKTPNVQPDDDCVVEVDHRKLIELYAMLGYKTEREATVRNDQMKYMLLPQFLTIGQVATIDEAMSVALPETIDTLQHAAIAILQSIVTIDTQNYESIEASEEAYRQWAKQQ